MIISRYELAQKLREAARTQLKLDEGAYYDSQISEAQADALLDAGYVVIHRSVLLFDSVGKDVLVDSPVDMGKYKNLLMAYILHVEGVGGSDFLNDDLEHPSILQEDWATLKEIAREMQLEGEDDADRGD